MQATAASKTVKTIGVTNSKIEYVAPIAIREFLSNVKSRWPAIKLAVSRTHNVIGRIMFLIISIITINEIKAVGVPCGTRCVSMWFVFLIQPNIMIDIHMVREIGNVIVRCDVREKMLGNKAIKFIIKIVMNIIMIIVSVLFSVFFIVNLTSFFIFVMIVFIIIEVGFFIFHIFVTINVVTNIVVSHDSDIVVELGSKMENKFVIILIVFSLLLFLYFYLVFFCWVLYLLYLLLVLLVLL